ncbi:MAG TPA: type 1 glutamine amidotransferase family protein [Terriglobales bacterium]|nr:type 1 glutamine amidotransferase family protein [Terriglobales bacterium]
MTNTAYLLLQDGYADWEPASAVAELRRTFAFAVKSLGLTAAPVISMGGLKVTPDLALADFVPETAAILILPGGDSWTQGEVPEVSRAARALIAAKRPVAAICAATLALAHCGLLDDRRHTSNGREFIGQFVKTYRGAEFYQPAPAVRDRGVITANGLAPIAFAAEIFRELAPARQDDIALYEKLYARGLLD